MEERMSDLSERLPGLAARPIVAVLPPGDGAATRRLAGVLVEAGCAAIAVRWPQPHLREALTALRETAAGQAVIAITSVPGPQEARQAVAAGAQLVISSAVRPSMVPVCHQADALCALGAMTATETLDATEAAADYVRLGPLEHLGGPAYLAALRAHFPWVAWIVAGNIPAEGLLGYRTHGAHLFELGASLLPPPLTAAGHEVALRAHVSRFLDAAVALPRVTDFSELIEW
jgi:2-dehydro-3-deoxyphosphogluconate aldolase/(4S)-4-hydroxy-2-oxoglutarate aldolase